MKKLCLFLIILTSTVVYAQNHKSSHSKIGNGNDAFGQTYLAQNVCGLNYVSASVLTETRTVKLGYNTNGTGFPTTLTIAGLPATYTLQTAYIYYGASYTEAAPPATVAHVTNPNNVEHNYNATLIGQAGAVCYGETGTATYRATITPDISGNGTYSVNITGFANAGSEVDGVTIVVVYVDPTATYGGNLAIWDGCASTISGTLSYTLSNIFPCTASSTAVGFGIYGSMAANVNGGNNTEVYNGTSTSFTNNFWQLNSITTTNLISCQDTISFNSYTNNTNGCFFISALGIYWQYPTCTACATIAVSLSATEPDCKNNDGTATVSVTGGTSPYKYTWTPNVGSTETVTGLSAGTYSVTVHDATCASGTASITLTISPVTVRGTVIANVNCRGESDGSAYAVVAGGIMPYTYVWNPVGFTGDTATGLNARTYTIVATDAFGCTASVALTITQPATGITITFTTTDATCTQSNGIANATATRGTAPYTFLWSSGATASRATGLSSGDYTVTVSGANGCSATASVDVAATASPIRLTTAVTANEECHGESTGAVRVTAAGGRVPYSYTWSPIGGSGTTATGLTAGIYTIAVEDHNECITSAMLDVTQPNQLGATITITPAACAGRNGEARIAVTGGTAAYRYAWSPGGQTRSTATGLTSGYYTVTTTDAHGCTLTSQAYVDTPTPVGITISSLSDISCYGLNNGSVTVTPTGGTSPFTYTWNPTGSKNDSLTGLSIGTYSVLVYDNHGCTGTSAVTITQPASALSASISFMINISCYNGNNGSIGVFASGGTPSYSYLWSPSGETSDTAITLTAGVYSVLVTDVNNCTTTATTTLTQPATPLNDTITTITNITCFNDTNGSATIGTIGGTAPYTYLWSPSGGTENIATGLIAGIYTITATDVQGCINTASVSITQPNALSCSISVTNIICYGENNGTASATPAGGTPNYSYSWSPVAMSSSAITGLSQGTYTLTINDANGCSFIDSVTIIQAPSPLTNTISQATNILCNGGNTGSATDAATGGAPSYSYLWTPSGITSSNATGLSAGTYSVAVTDSLGCVVTASVILTQPLTLTDNINTFIDLKCYGDNTGSATQTVAGGTQNYSYSWAPSGGNGITATGLTAGNYTATVTDANNCIATVSIDITQPTELNLTTSTISAPCGSNKGSATVAVAGGTSPYFYSWKPTGQTNSTATGLTGGTYTVTVTDDNGCTATAAATVAGSPAVTGTVKVLTDVACHGDKTGSAEETAQGGTFPYNYLWTPNGGTDAIATGLTAGDYTVIITDANGCQTSDVVTITQPTALATSNNSTNVTCYGGDNGIISINANGGTSPYQYEWSNGETDNLVTNLSAGTYTITITDANNCNYSTMITINQPQQLTVANNIINTNCDNTSTGSAQANPNGGTPPYFYLWSNSNTSGNISNLSVGKYSVVITDNAGCMESDTLSIGYDTAVTAVASDTATCSGVPVKLNASQSINATQYKWFQLPGMKLIGNKAIVPVSPDSGTTKYLLLAYSGDCTNTDTVKVTINPASFANAGVFQQIFSGNIANLGGSPTGPAGSNFYWQPFNGLNDTTLSNPTATPKVTTTYTVYVTNPSGCVASDTVTVELLSGISIPEGFSPNADGINDYWVIPNSENFPNIVVEVYNRWGQKVFSSTGYPTPWDGKYDGKPLPVGTYYFIVKLNSPEFPKAITGPLTIMR